MNLIYEYAKGQIHTSLNFTALNFIISVQLQTYRSPSGFQVLSDKQDIHTHTQHALAVSLEYKYKYALCLLHVGIYIVYATTLRQHTLI